MRLNPAPAPAPAGTGHRGGAWGGLKVPRHRHRHRRAGFGSENASAGGRQRWAHKYRISIFSIDPYLTYPSTTPLYQPVKLFS